MATQHYLSRLMKMSWEIQRKRSCKRSKALIAAWAILSNEEITLYYLTRRLNRDKPLNPTQLKQITLFNPLTH